LVFADDGREKIVESIKTFGRITLKALSSEMPAIDRGNTQGALFVGDIISFGIINPNRDRRPKNLQYLVEIQGEYGVQVSLQITFSLILSL